MKVLVTGHDGYIGTVLVPMLVASGHEVTGLDTSFFAGCGLGEVTPVPDSARLDIRDATPQTLDGFDAVVHLAALSNDPLGDIRAEVTHDINHRATVALAWSAREAGVTRFVFASSCSLYGAAEGTEPLDEGAAFNPVTPYGESKVWSERDVGALASGSFSPTFLRNATAYGMSPRVRGDLVVNNLVGTAFTTGRVMLQTNGEQWRPLVHVQDICRAMLAVLEAPRDLVHNEAFNVGSTRENYRIRDVASVIEQVVDGSRVELSDRATADLRNYRVTCDKFTERLGFRTEWTVERGAREVLDAYAAHGLSYEQLTGPPMQRLARINELIRVGALDTDMRWRREDAGRGSNRAARAYDRSMTSNAINSLLVAGLVAAIAVVVAGFLPTARAVAQAVASLLLAVGPVLAVVLLPHARALVVVVALLGGALAVFGCLTARAASAGVLHTLAAAVAALGAVIAGLRFGPTGVAAFDVIGGFAVVLGVTLAFAGFDRPGGLATTVGIPAALGVLALAGFANQDGLAAVAAVATATCLGSLTLHTHDRTLPVERGARLLVGYLVGAGALAMFAVDREARPASTAITLLSLLLLDAAMVVVGRLRRRQPLWGPRRDHLVDRFTALGWSRGFTIALLMCVQLALAGLAVFSGRGVLDAWIAPAAALVLVVVLAFVAGQADLPERPTRRVSRWVVLGVGVIVVAAIAGAVPTALAVPDVADTMERGRDAAKQALADARDGETTKAAAAFEDAAAEFSDAGHELSSPGLFPARAVPYVAANVNAARTLAEVGETLAEEGRAITVAIDPDTLEVVDGRLPVETVRSITPELETGSGALARALERIDGVLDEPYLVDRIRSAVESVRDELVAAEREADHASAAARLAPALFGDDGERRYLLVVQNNAESRPTGGFIGNFGVITANDGKLSVSELPRTAEWNRKVRAIPDLGLDAPADYRTHYAQFLPQTTLQNVNMSADFPTVAQVLMDLTPAAGVGPVDGVISVDPEGLAALLELTGPVEVDSWPEEIDADNVVPVTLKEAYAAYPETPERAEFLGDVARAAVDKATTGKLGSPARIADVLGRAAHDGHVQLAFARPAEQELAEQLDVSGRLAPVRSDALAVAGSNMAGNKIDTFLQRHVDYQVSLEPGRRGTRADASAQLRVQLDNTAPAEGLPEAVIGPSLPQFVAGQNRMYLSVYTPLEMTDSTLDGSPVQMAEFGERGRNVYTRFVDVPAQSSKVLDAGLRGAVDLPGGWYSLDLKHQAVLNDDLTRVSISVPEGWRIDKTNGAQITGPRTAEVETELTRDETVRVHLVRSSDGGGVWSQLVAGD